MKGNKGLGKGFGSLLPDDFDQSILLDKEERINKIKLTRIKANPNQPRRHFDEGSLNELAASIKTYGLLQPLVLSPEGDGYVIIAGERRFRAAKIAGLSELPALIRSSEELERIEIGLVENVQREDLSPLEQAVSIVRLHEEFNVDYRDVAVRLGKAYSTITNIVRLLQLPENARKALEQNKISEGHARTILSLKDSPRLQDELLAGIIKKGWSVRAAEKFVSEAKQREGVGTKTKLVVGKQYLDRSRDLAKKLSAEVNIKPLRYGGRIEISYKSEKELDKILNGLLD
ncbi:MAG TPA: ParB/RepB/Spo0J family partition protein [Candidatus Saccharimonadales bacterium]|nr:ParB/RepB/Spo0J family partition protein [Candidatus Saccharimonadales bacterium]